MKSRLLRQLKTWSSDNRKVLKHYQLKFPFADRGVYSEARGSTIQNNTPFLHCFF